MACYILLSSFMSVIREILHCGLDFRGYMLDMFNYIQLIGVGTMATTAIFALDPIELFHFWMYPLASVRFGLFWSLNMKIEKIDRTLSV